MLSGMRPSGFLHLGNYLGALQNWVKLQDEYRCYFFIADWHALTTEYEYSAQIGENISEMVLDWLSAGLDPDRAVIFANRISKNMPNCTFCFPCSRLSPGSNDALHSRKRSARLKEGSSIRTDSWATPPCFRRPIYLFTRQTPCR